jgi:radical SAM protein with 4Fe4S-binding SPASM domain
MYKIPFLFDLLRTTQRRGMRATLVDLYSILAQPTLVPAWPRHMQLEVTTYCNLGCVMCPRTHSLAQASTEEEKTAWRQHISWQEFEHIISHIPNLQTISLHGIGEPLLHPHIFAMIDAASARGIRVGFTTNATLLSPAVSKRLIDAGLHWLIISMDGATTIGYESIRVHASFQQVCEHIQYLMTIRNQARHSTPFVQLAMVVSTMNQNEVPQFLQLASRLGVDGGILSPLEPPAPDMEALVCDAKSWQYVRSTAHRHADELGISLYIRGDGTLPPAPHTAAKRTYRCLEPWKASTITVTGDVMPCCNIHHPAYSMGNIAASRFTDIWNGSQYQKFRAELRQTNYVPEPCRWCPDF